MFTHMLNLCLIPLRNFSSLVLCMCVIFQFVLISLTMTVTVPLIQLQY